LRELAAYSVLIKRWLKVLVQVFVAILGVVAVHGFVAPAGEAQNIFEKLVMPGPLIKGHEKYRESCNKCHAPFKRQAQTGLCLDCHDKVGADRKARQGFHGKNQIAKNRACRHCHTEHKGRDADITGLDPSTFNHEETDFELKGRHRSLVCGQCHKQGEVFRKAPGACIGCHRRDDRHKGRLGDNCVTCHNEKKWNETAYFDHGKTSFALVDSHKKVGCEKCHAGEVYKGVPTTCNGCHNLQDVHKGAYGSKCQTCHRPLKWTDIRFDHEKDTKFPLRGRHKKVKCEGCHVSDLYNVKLSIACNGCHGAHDPHKGSLGPDCKTCHGESSWFEKVAFDHDLSRFPLIGLHAAVGCASCHRTKTYRDAPKRCVACHGDDYHQGRIGSDCARCHTPNGWERWIFDHGREAHFELTGAHAAISCQACHKANASGKVTAPKSCTACHANDDAHRGSFGRACESCHSTKSFRPARFRR